MSFVALQAVAGRLTREPFPPRVSLHLARIFIVLATLLTWPLAVQPVSTVFGQTLVSLGFGVSSRYTDYGAIENGTAAVTGTVQSTADFDNGGKKGRQELPSSLYYGLRLVLVIFTGVCATSVPNFGVVVSLLGSFAVTLGSFVLPPLFHLVVFRGRQTQGAEMADLVLFILGALTCAFTTTTTALSVINGDF